jgi:hypothetical protein
MLRAIRNRVSSTDVRRPLPLPDLSRGPPESGRHRADLAREYRAREGEPRAFHDRTSDVTLLQAEGVRNSFGRVADPSL